MHYTSPKSCMEFGICQMLGSNLIPTYLLCMFLFQVLHMVMDIMMPLWSRLFSCSFNHESLFSWCHCLLSAHVIYKITLTDAMSDVDFSLFCDASIKLLLHRFGKKYLEWISLLQPMQKSTALWNWEVKLQPNQRLWNVLVSLVSEQWGLGWQQAF